MARLPRIVISGEPLHTMHRGNSRQGILRREEECLFLLTPHTVKALLDLMQLIEEYRKKSERF